MYFYFAIVLFNPEFRKYVSTLSFLCFDVAATVSAELRLCVRFCCRTVAVRSFLLQNRGWVFLSVQSLFLPVQSLFLPVQSLFLLVQSLSMFLPVAGARSCVWFQPNGAVFCSGEEISGGAARIKPIVEPCEIIERTAILLRKVNF
jgi:hypothetical protein